MYKVYAILKNDKSVLSWTGTNRKDAVFQLNRLPKGYIIKEVGNTKIKNSS